MRKERALPLSPLMVTATLADLKTETRRNKGLKQLNKAPAHWLYLSSEKDPKGVTWYLFNNMQTGEGWSLKCPYGEVGDLLYGKEMFVDWGDGTYSYKADGFKKNKEGKWELDTPHKLHDSEVVSRFTSGMFMPKEAARIWLELVDIAIEQVQDITQTGAIAEGIERTPNGWKDYRPGFETSWWPENHATGSYMSLFVSLYGEDPWFRNEWVWVLRFRVLSKRGRDRIASRPQTAIL